MKLYATYGALPILYIAAQSTGDSSTARPSPPAPSAYTRRDLVAPLPVLVHGTPVIGRSSRMLGSRAIPLIAVNFTVESPYYGL